MIPDSSFQLFFYSSISLITIIGALPLLKYSKLEDFPLINLYFGIGLLLLVTILLIGFRNPFGSHVYFGDTGNYTRKFFRFLYDPSYKEEKDTGFYLYMKALSNIVSIKIFYLISAALYILPVFFCFKKFFNEKAYFALILFISSMSFLGFGINGVRNGLATSFFIFALIFYEKKIVMFAIILIASTFHKSVLLPGIALFAVHLFGNTKILLKIWAASIPIAFILGRTIQSSIGKYLSSSINSIDERSSNLLSTDAGSLVETSSSFRLDFIIYSSAAVYIGYYFIYKLDFKDAFFNKIFNTYLIVNTIWIFLIYAPYTNRTAYLSWFLMPLIIAYPVIKTNKLKNQSMYMCICISISLAFTWLLYLK